MKACLLIKTKPGKHNTVTNALNDIEGILNVFPVLGRTDVVANVKISDLTILTELVLKVLIVEGVDACETLVGLEV
jgi:hypothetical protein